MKAVSAAVMERVRLVPPPSEADNKSSPRALEIIRPAASGAPFSPVSVPLENRPSSAGDDAVAAPSP